SENFQTVFSELVEGGRAQLVIQREKPSVRRRRAPLSALASVRCARRLPAADSVLPLPLRPFVLLRSQDEKGGGGGDEEDEGEGDRRGGRGRGRGGKKGAASASASASASAAAAAAGPGSGESGESAHYTGIGFKVSFTGAEADKRGLTVLSGGQQSVLALA